MKKPKSGISYIKVIGAITLCLYLALSFSPSKALAAHVSFSSRDTLSMISDKSVLSPTCEGEIVKDFSQYTPSTLYDEVCCGDEFRLEVNLDAREDGSNVIFDGDIKLFDGSCNSERLEDNQKIRVVAPIGSYNRTATFKVQNQNLVTGTLYFEAY